MRIIICSTARPMMKILMYPIFLKIEFHNKNWLFAWKPHHTRVYLCGWHTQVSYTYCMCIMHTGCCVAADVDCLNDKRKLLWPLNAMYEMS